MNKKYFCRCVYHNGRKVECELESNLGKPFNVCPYDSAQANWIEIKDIETEKVTNEINS